MQLKIVIGLVIIIVASAFLIFSGLQKASVYYVTLSELKAMDPPHDRGIRVSGTVDPATIQWKPDSLNVFFKLIENKDTLCVYYNGIIPEQLRAAQVVVVEGQLNGDVFNASKILLKCPSKYEQKSSAQHFNAAKSQFLK